MSVNDANGSTATISLFGDKVGRGPKTGVHLCFHTWAEYVKLSAAEKRELYEHQTSEGNYQAPNGDGTKKLGRSQDNKTDPKKGKSCKYALTRKYLHPLRQQLMQN